MSLSKFFVYFLLVLLVGSCFSVFLLGSAQVDSSVLSMGGKDWSIKVDSIKSDGLVSVYSSEKVDVKVSDKPIKELFSTLKDLKTAQGLVDVEYYLSLSGLVVYKQKALDKELDVKQYSFVNATHAVNGSRVVDFRPLDVVNSFACVDGSGKKVLHIYASKLIDAGNNSCWVDSDIVGNVLSIHLNQTWLASAKFPVVVDPTFGYTSVGGSSNSIGDYYRVAVSQFTGGNDKVFTQMNIYLSGSGYARVALLNGTAAAGTPDLIAQSSLFLVDGAGWYSQYFDELLDDGETYQFGFIGNGTVLYYYDSGVGEWGYQESGGSMSFPSSLSTVNPNDKFFSIYGVYGNVPTPSPSLSPSSSPTLVPIDSGELNNSFLFVLGFMSIFCLISMVWLVNTRAGAVVGFFIGLFTFFVALYSALGGVYTLGVPQGWFGLFVALFGGLTMLLVGLGVRVKR